MKCDGHLTIRGRGTEGRGNAKAIGLKTFFNFLINVYIPIAKEFLVPISTELRADEARQILDPYEMSRIIVLYVQQIDMLVHLPIYESYRKNREFFLFLDAVYIEMS